MNSMAGKRVKLYAAPMEGVTGYIYRNIIDDCFGGADRYFTPFISTNTNKTFTEQERRDIDSGNNRPGDVIPQILSNNSCDCIKVIRALHDEYGYDEVNLNLGCPSPTVVTKHKGAGFLAFPDKLDSFLNDVFVAAGKDGVRVSVKTRTGVESHDEFIKILDIYNQYPLSELIVHPRVQKDLYKNSPDYDIFEYAYANSGNVYLRAIPKTAGQSEADRIRQAVANQNMDLENMQFVYYEVELVDAAGNPLTFDGNITVTFAYPEGTDAQTYTFKVLHLLKSGVLDVMDPYVISDGLSVEVSELSPFAIAYKEAASDVVQTGENVSSTQTGDRAPVVILMALIAVSAAVLLGITYSSKNRKSER